MKCFLKRSVFRMAVLTMVFLAMPGWTQESGKQTPQQNTDRQGLAGQRRNVSSAELFGQTAEDYSNPALAGSPALSAIVPLQLEFDQIDPNFTREIVRVQWRANDPIDLYIVAPVGVKNPPVVLYLHDYPTENEAYMRAEFCRLLTEGGFAAVGFVPALTGQRYHDRPMKQWFVSELRESLGTSAHDVQMVLNYLATRGDMDMNRVGMFGAGSGATIAILAAGVDSRIKALDLVDPWGDWPDWIAKAARIPEKERPDFLKPEWVANVAPLDPVKWLPELKTQKLRIQLVKDAAVTPAEVQQSIAVAAPANAQIVRYDSAAAFRRATSGGVGFEWVKQQLQPGAVQRYHVPGGSSAGAPTGKGGAVTLRWRTQPDGAGSRRFNANS